MPIPKSAFGWENLKNATNLMTLAVNQLLNNAATTETHLRFEKMNASLALNRICSYYQAKADEKHIHLSCDPSIDIPPIWTDRARRGRRCGQPCIQRLEVFTTWKEHLS